MNYYPFHIGDYAVHTRHLSLMEDLAYRRLIDWYYVHERAIPAETQSVARLIGMRDHVVEIEAVLLEFFTPNDVGEWVNGRCEAEISRAKAAAERARANGAKGGRKPSTPRKPAAQDTSPPAPPNPKNPLGSDSVPDGGPDESKSKAPKTKTNTKENPPTPRKRGESTEAQGLRFEEFWLSWPKNERKQDRAKCWGHWRRNGLDALADAILADVRTKRETTKWQEGFVEVPLVYLRGKRWEDGVTPDEPKPAAAGQAPVQQGSAAPDADTTRRMLAEQAARAQAATAPPESVRQLLRRKVAHDLA